MDAARYIQVLLPLRLEWDPFYLAEEEVAVGDRVSVSLSGRRYNGVVSAVDVTPDPGIKTILPATRVDLPSLPVQVLAFWNELSQYYLCTAGEVFKTASSALINRQVKPRKKEEKPVPATLPSVSNPPCEALDGIRKGFAQGKTVLLEGPCYKDRTKLYLELARETLSQGRSVLILLPNMEMAAAFPPCLRFHSGLTEAGRRKVTQAVMSEEPCLVVGTRSALFLPFRNLGLILVEDEHDSAYKQDSPAPRYHARDAAILLAQTTGAHVVLSSETPSLESQYNADKGLFTAVQLKESIQQEELLVNLAAEKRKKGVSGSFSFQLLAQMKRCREEGKKILLVCRSKASIPDCAAELETLFGQTEQDIVLSTPALAKGQPAHSFGLVAVLLADSLLSKEDFRCDERAMQALSMLRSRCTPDGLLVVQTFESRHPAFGPWNRDAVDRLLRERLQFGLPPYTRLVQLTLEDSSEKRLAYMSALLLRQLKAVLPQPVSISGDSQTLRIFLQRDKQLRQHKKTLYSTLLSFEKDHHYAGHIHLDVDPV